jgi:hypothetical protein
MGFVLKISAAATRDWRAAAWLLGRLNPADFARQESITLKTQDGGGLPIQIIHSIPSTERPARGTAQVIALDGGKVTGPKATGPDEV